MESSTGAPTQAAPSEGQGAETQGQEAQRTGTAPTGGQDKTQAMKDAAQEVMRKFRVKVDGEELEVDEKELLRGYSHQRAANKILQEGKMAKKQAEMFVSMLKDPQKAYEVLQKLGHDPRSLSEEYLAKQIKREMMDPKDRELEEARAKLKSYEELEQKQKEAERQKAIDQMKQKYLEEYNQQFVGALKETNLPPTKETVAKMAQYIKRAATLNYELTPVEAAKLVKEDFQRLVASVAGQTDGDMLLSLLGDQAAEKILQARGSKIKRPEDVLSTPQQQGQRRDRQSMSATEKDRRRQLRGW